MKQKKYTFEQIDYLFADNNEITDEQKLPLFKALSILDTKLIDKIAEEVWFISTTDVWAFYLPLDASHLKGKKAIIILSEKTFRGTEKEAQQTILHEVAHHVLGHKCFMDIPFGDEGAFHEKQEADADRLAEKWMGK